MARGEVHTRYQEVLQETPTQATIRHLENKRQSLLEGSREIRDMSLGSLAIGLVLFGAGGVLGADILGALGILELGFSALLGGVAGIDRLRAAGKGRKIRNLESTSSRRVLTPKLA